MFSSELYYRNKNLEDSVVLLVGLVKYIREQLNKEAT